MKLSLVAAALLSLVSAEDDPHYYVYPHRPQNFPKPQLERRSLLPFLKVRDLPMSGLVYLKRIKPIADAFASKEEVESTSITAAQTEVKSSEKLTEEDVKILLSVKPIFDAASPKPSSPAPFPPPTPLFTVLPESVRKQLDQQQLAQLQALQASDPDFGSIQHLSVEDPAASGNRIQSAPTRPVTHPVVGNAFVAPSHSVLQLPRGAQFVPAGFERRATNDIVNSDLIAGGTDEIVVASPRVPHGSPWPAQTLLRSGPRPVLVDGNPVVGPSYPWSPAARARSAPTHRGSADKMVSISVFRLRQ